jgi:acylphosphatase
MPIFGHSSEIPTLDKTVKALVTVSGRVQGVFYRQSTKDKAESLGLTGWVKNESNGKVALEAQGPRGSIESLIQWCHEGPPYARVEKVDVQWSEGADQTEVQSGFRILH